MSKHLNDQFFRRLSGKLPAFKRDYAEKRMAEKAKNNGGSLKQPPCCVCGKYFGSKIKEFSLSPVKNKPFCPACQSHLDDGCAVFNTLDLNGYAIIRLPGKIGDGPLGLDTGKLNGKISLVTWEEIQMLTSKPVDGRKVFELLSRLISEIPEPAAN